MLDRFLHEVLKLSNYKLIQHKTGKDNITYEVISRNNDSFIIQQLSSSKTQENKNFIEAVIGFTERMIPKIHFGGNYQDQRFFSFEGKDFQVMKRIPGKSINIENIDCSIIWKSAQYLAVFHKGISNFPYKEYSHINEYKDMFQYRTIAEKYVSTCNNRNIKRICNSMSKQSQGLVENINLPIGVIHGDPSFKNFLIDNKKNITGLIDYDMMSVTTILWDLADMIRSYLKLDIFDKKTFLLLLKSYNAVRQLTREEEYSLQDYCSMMVLNTGFRYIISYFENTNFLGGKKDCLEKSQRCLNELKKLDTFFI